MLTKCFFIFLLSFASLSFSEEFAQPLTLSELLDIALKNNPTTKQAWWNAQRASASLGSANSMYYPQVGLEGFVSNGRTFKFVNGPDTTYTMVGTDVVLSLLLYDSGGRNAEVNSAKQALLAANWQTDWSIQKVMAVVLENAYELAHAQETLRAMILTQEDGEKILQTAKELNRAGLNPITDVYTALATHAQTKMETEQQKAHVDIKKGKLLASLGLKVDTHLELASFNQLPAPEKKQLTDLIDIACKQRADLMAKQVRVAESQFGLDKAQSGYGPKVSIRGSGGANRAFQDKANAMQYDIRLNAEIPLFDGFDTMYRNRMAYADTRLSIEEVNDLRLNIYLDVLTYSRLLEAAQVMLPDAEDNLTNALKAYEGMLERYQAGKSEISDVSMALRQLAAARTRYSDVKTRWLVSLANLAFATGTLGPYTETSCESLN